LFIFYAFGDLAVTQRIELPPLLIAGGYIRLDLHGRHGVQPSDKKYYTVIERVKAFGIPLGKKLSFFFFPPFFSLKYCLKTY